MSSGGAVRKPHTLVAEETVSCMTIATAAVAEAFEETKSKTVVHNLQQLVIFFCL